LSRTGTEEAHVEEGHLLAADDTALAHVSHSQASPLQTPPQPVLAFRVGVTGTRDLNALPDATRAAIERQVREILSEIRQQIEIVGRNPAAQSTYRTERSATPHPVLRVVSPLAEGSDRHVASVATELGYALDVALPFARTDYATDFADSDSRSAFDRLLGEEGSIEAQHYFVLDGARGVDETRSYEAVGRFVVRNCDLLIAVWNGCPARGRGGTAEIVQFATRFGRPIWWIDASASSPPRLVRSGADLRTPGRAPQGGKAASILADLIAGMLVPPHIERHGHSLIGRALHTLHAWGRRLPSLAGQSLDRRLAPLNDPLQVYLSERPRPDRWLWRLYDWGYRRIGGPSQVPRLPAVPDPSRTARYWEAMYGPADAAAAAYADRYRSSYVWVFLLATLAVTCAVLSLAHEPIKPAATVCEIGILLMICALVSVNERRNWHGRWIAYRLLAELCRKQGALASFGWSLPPPSLRRSLPTDKAGGAGRIETWVAWYFDALIRAAPLPTGQLGEEQLSAARRYVRITLVEEQRVYHLDRKARSRRAGIWLVRAGEYTFFTTLVLVAVKLCFLMMLPAHDHLGHDPAPHTDLLHYAVVALGTLAAVLPALSAAFVGIRAYAELELLVSQSERMVAVMNEAAARIDSLDLARPLASQDLAAEIFDVSSEMLHEVGGWADLFTIKAVEAG
jgi:hypothetical protein